MNRLIRLRHLLSLCLAFGVLVSSCGSENIWEFERETFEDSLRRGAYDFLEDISFQNVDPEEIHRLGPGSATAMSLVFTRIGMFEEARRMLQSEWESGEEPWKGEAGFALTEGCLEREEYLRCLPIAEELAEEYGSFRAYRRLLEARYWLLDNEAALDLLEEIKERFPDAAASDGELLLFEAALLSRLDREGWRSAFTRLFSTVPAGELHIRALDYLRLSGLFSGNFDSLKENLFEMKYASAAGLYPAGTDRAGAFLAGLSLPLPEEASSADGSIPVVLTDVILEDITLLFLLAGRPLEGYRLLAPLIEAAETARASGRGSGSLAGASVVKLAEAAGRLLRKGGLYREAIDRFDEALEAAGAGNDPTGGDRSGSGPYTVPRLIDRLLWFRADCYYELGAEPLVDHLPDLVSRWNNPAYFTDLLDELGTALTASGEWDLIRRAWIHIRERGAGEAAARLAYILWRSPIGRTYAAGEDDLPLFMEDLLSPEAGRYYPLLAGVLTGSGGELPGIPGPRGGLPDSEVPEDREDLSPGGVRVVKLMEFGLLLEAFEEARRAEVEGFLFLELGRRLEDRGLYREAVLCGEAAAAQDSRRGLERIYPRYFAGLGDEIVADYPIPEPLLYALIREESYFDSRIVSRAGAVGLTQLMPMTAAEMARRLDVDEYDVLDPGTNLLLGGYYFYTLLNRFPTPVHAISAYNAGPTRVRRWERSFGTLPADLFLEAIPFKETRNHCRKVLVSAVYYGYLYGDLDPAEVVAIFFPDFME